MQLSSLPDHDRSKSVIYRKRIDSSSLSCLLVTVVSIKRERRWVAVHWLRPGADLTTMDE
jgi:hypothetical protein